MLIEGALSRIERAPRRAVHAGIGQHLLIRPFGALPKTAQHVSGHEEISGHYDGVAQQPQPPRVCLGAPPKNEARSGAAVQRLHQENPGPIKGSYPPIPPGPGKVSR